MLPAAIVAGCPVLVWLVLNHRGVPTLALGGALAVTVAIYVGLWHPLWLYWCLAFVLAILPFGYVPGVHVPLYLLFAAGVVMAAIIYPRPEMRFHRLEIAVLVLVVAAGVSVIVTSLSLEGMIEYVRWSIVTLVAVALTRLSRADLERFGRIFVWMSAANAAWGILLVTIDKAQKSFVILRPFGYSIGNVDETVRGQRQDLINWVYNADGSQSIRLGGTWVAGNGAGLAFLIAIAVCVLLFRGWRRNCMVIVLSVALLLTQSRQAVFTLLIGLVLVAIFHTMRTRDRWWAVGALSLMVVVALSVPYIRQRLLNSLSGDDPGGAARRASLSDFPGEISGHWLFGKGWDIPEFRSPTASYALNLISNAPLLHIYRAGIITGLVFIAIMVIGCIIGYRALRSDSVPFAVFGGIFIAFCVVALQLDHGVGDVPQTCLCFSIFIAFLVYVDRSLRAPPQPSVHAKEPALAASP
jgi:hypothetical protein